MVLRDDNALVITNVVIFNARALPVWIIQKMDADGIVKDFE